MSSCYVQLLLGLSLFVIITQCGAKKRKHECQNSAECWILKGAGFSCIKKRGKKTCKRSKSVVNESKCVLSRALPDITSGPEVNFFLFVYFF